MVVDIAQDVAVWAIAGVVLLVLAAIVVGVPAGLLGLVTFFVERSRAKAAKRNAERARQDQARKDLLRETQVAAETAHRAWSYRLQSMALTCPRCGKLAVPLPATPDRYGCPACNHRFVGARHDVPLPPPGP